MLSKLLNSYNFFSQAKPDRLASPCTKKDEGDLSTPSSLGIPEARSSPKKGSYENYITINIGIDNHTLFKFKI